MSDEIRAATPADFQEIFRLCCLLHSEIGEYPFEEIKVREIVWRALNRDGGMIGVIGTPDDIKAMILLTIEEVSYSSSLELIERWNYVRSDCRKFGYGSVLVRFAKRCSDETGLTLKIGIMTQKRLAAKRRLYERELPLAGCWFAYDPNNEEHRTYVDRAKSVKPWEEQRVSRREWKRRNAVEEIA